MSNNPVSYNNNNNMSENSTGVYSWKIDNKKDNKNVNNNTDEETQTQPQ